MCSKHLAVRAACSTVRAPGIGTVPLQMHLGVPRALQTADIATPAVSASNLCGTGLCLGRVLSFLTHEPETDLQI